VTATMTSGPARSGARATPAANDVDLSGEAIRLTRPRAGPAALAGLDPALPRHTAAAAYLHERDGDPVTAARLKEMHRLLAHFNV
jgi:hypothetical protein